MSEVVINVTKVEEVVTINATPNVTQILVNTNNTIPQNLNQVLTEGNATDGENIFISDNDEITFDNGSRIRKGLTDADNGGAKGVALVCSLDYELKWEAGRQYIMQQDGFTIREVSHNFTITPSATDDSTKGFVIDSRWILDNGDVYVCTDATIDNAVWELQVTDVQDLQNVTDIGNVTTNPIFIPELQLYDAATDAYAKISYSDGQFDFRDINGRIIKVIEKDGLEQTLNLNDFTLTKEISSLTANRTRTEPNKDGTYAMLDDIPDVQDFQNVTDIGNVTTNDIYIPKLYLYDEPNDNYGSLHYTDGNFHIEDADNHKLLVIEDGFLQLHLTDTIQSNLFLSNLTETRDHYLPDESGIIALRSDIPSVDATPTDGSENAVSSNGVFDALALKQNSLGYIPLPTTAGTATGATLSFVTDRIYGTIASPITGNITADVTGAQLGVTNIIIHNSGTAPTFSSEYKKLSGSGNYVVSVVNYIYCTFITSTEIIYSINQRT